MNECSPAFGRQIRQVNIAATGNQSIVAPAANEIVVVHRVILGSTVACSAVFNYGAGHTAFGGTLLRPANDSGTYDDLRWKAVIGQEAFINITGGAPQATIYYYLAGKV